MGTAARRSRRDKRPCELPLLRQLEGRERSTIRLGEHPRDCVRRVDLLADDLLDDLRARHPTTGEEAIDAALLLDEQLEAALERRGLGVVELSVLPARPLLAVFVCLACGRYEIAEIARDWATDAAVRGGLHERDRDRS